MTKKARLRRKMLRVLKRAKVDLASSKAYEDLLVFGECWTEISPKGCRNIPYYEAQEIKNNILYGLSGSGN